MLNNIILTIMFISLSIAYFQYRYKLYASLNLPKPGELQKRTILEVCFMQGIIVFLAYSFVPFYEKLEYANLYVACFVAIIAVLYTFYYIKKRQLYAAFDFGFIIFYLFILHALLISVVPFLTEMPFLSWSSVSWTVYAVLSSIYITALAVITIMQQFHFDSKKFLKRVWNKKEASNNE